MRKLLATGLVALAAISLAGCAGSRTDQDAPPAPTVVEDTSMPSTFTLLKEIPISGSGLEPGIYQYCEDDGSLVRFAYGPGGGNGRAVYYAVTAIETLTNSPVCVPQ